MQLFELSPDVTPMLADPAEPTAFAGTSVKGPSRTGAAGGSAGRWSTIRAAVGHRLIAVGVALARDDRSGANASGHPSAPAAVRGS